MRVRACARARAWVAAARWCYALRFGGTKPLRFHLERIDIERCQRANISANINHSTGFDILTATASVRVVGVGERALVRTRSQHTQTHAHN